MEISVVLADANGSLITGAAASTALKIRRVVDGFLLDWADLTFKAATWGTLAATLTEVDATNLPGEYKKVVVITAWDDGFYQALVHFDDATTVLNFSGEIYIYDGVEVDVGIGAIKVKTDNLPSDPADESLLEAAIESLKTGILEGTITYDQFRKILLSALAGKSDGIGTVTVHTRDVANSKNRITATVDASGNRTAVVLDGA